MDLPSSDHHRLITGRRREQGIYHSKPGELSRDAVAACSRRVGANLLQQRPSFQAIANRTTLDWRERKIAALGQACKDVRRPPGLTPNIRSWAVCAA